MDDPADMPPARWQSRLAGLRSSRVPDTDPRMIEVQAALAYWRVRRVIDHERGLLASQHLPALADMLRHPHAAVPA